MRMNRNTLLMGVGHICFECHRVIEYGTITGGYLGNLPIYYHTACIFDEGKAQELKWATQEGEVVEEPIDNELIEEDEDV